MDNDNVIVTFNGGYERVGQIMVSQGVCDVCKLEAKVIGIDASEGEYHCGHICLSCVKKHLGR